MKQAIDDAKHEGDTVGGIFEVRVTVLPAGLGSCFRRDDRMDARLAAAVMAIQAVKGVEIGTAFANSARRARRFTTKSSGTKVSPRRRAAGSAAAPTTRAGWRAA